MIEDKRQAGERQEKSRALEGQLVKMLWPLLVALKRKVCRAFSASGPAQAHQTRLFQSARRSSHLCVGLPLAADLGGGAQGNTNFSSHALVDHRRAVSWPARSARRNKLLLIASLLSLLTPTLDTLSTWLLRTFCHRTGLLQLRFIACVSLSLAPG